MVQDRTCGEESKEARKAKNRTINPVKENYTLNLHSSLSLRGTGKGSS